MIFQTIVYDNVMICFYLALGIEVAACVTLSQGKDWWQGLSGCGGFSSFPWGDRNTEGVISISQILPPQKSSTCSPLHLQPGQRQLIKSRQGRCRQRLEELCGRRGRKRGGISYRKSQVFHIWRGILYTGFGLCFRGGFFMSRVLRESGENCSSNQNYKWNCFEYAA